MESAKIWRLLSLPLMASELNSLATNVKGAGKADLNTKAAKKEHFEQKVTEFTAQQAATKVIGER